ncbi:MAG: peptide ABC transporter [Acidimicrobiaceae bacterium]|nr:peptide ABC transporter [Acidimicrobiaceae bacterium]
MLNMIMRRLGAAVIIFFLVSILVFALILLVPGDPAVAVAGENADADRIEAIRSQLGLDDPIIVQYWNWLTDALTGDFGNSLVTGESVISGLTERLPATASLMILSVSLAVIGGVPAGLLAGLRPGSVFDRGASVLATIGLAVPSFWLALVLIMFFSLDLGWFPAVGYTPFTENPWNWFLGLTLPAITLGTAGMAEIARQTRAGVADTSRREYVQTAYANGVPEHRVVGRHILRNASIPIVTVLGLQVAGMLGGSVITETIFGIDGIGSYAVQAVSQRDFPVVQGMVLFVTIIVLIVNLLVDISYGMINPKVRSA